jgi:hypothetical protein
MVQLTTQTQPLASNTQQIARLTNVGSAHASAAPEVTNIPDIHSGCPSDRALLFCGAPLAQNRRPAFMELHAPIVTESELRGCP